MEEFVLGLVLGMLVMELINRVMTERRGKPKRNMMKTEKELESSMTEEQKKQRDREIKAFKSLMSYDENAAMKRVDK